MILHQENLDYKRHCQFTFGEYVLGHDEPLHTNTNAPRALDCIYLRPSSNAQGGHEVLHLQTNKVVHLRKCTAMPLTPSIIKQVHKIAEMENMPKGLKIRNRANQILFDSAWIAGVNYKKELLMMIVIYQMKVTVMILTIVMKKMNMTKWTTMSLLTLWMMLIHSMFHIKMKIIIKIKMKNSNNNTNNCIKNKQVIMMIELS